MPEFRVGDVVVKRVGLHVDQHTPLLVTRVTPTSLQVRPKITNMGRAGTRRNGKTWTIPLPRAQTTLRLVR